LQPTCAIQIRTIPVVFYNFCFTFELNCADALPRRKVFSLKTVERKGETTMIEILKKTYLAGAGLAAKTWDEVESLSKEVVQKAKMSEKEGAKFIKDMKKRYDDTQKKTGTYVEKVVKATLKKMDIATAADIKALKKDIRQLKKAAGITGAKKRTAGKTAKKRTTTAAKKRTLTAAKKRTSTAAKKTVKRTRTTAAKKRAGSTSAKKRTGRAAVKKR
jgi:polyhydroxyalkanoate synthesis regulator phasin